MKSTLDQTDIKILNLLQSDARLELSTLSGRVFKSPSSVYERIKKLKENGFIRGYVTVLDPHKIGRSFLAITQVTLSTHTQAALVGFAKEAGQLPEVMLCLQLSGACDFVLHIAVPDSQAYQDFLLNKLCVMDHVGQVQTSVVLNEVKMNGVYAL